MKKLAILMLVYGVASLVHFIHNAEYLGDYPGLPTTWTRAGVYLVWLGVAATGLVGWLLVKNRHEVIGLLLVAVYAAAGLDSLGHYVLAPLSAHTHAMNATILFEVAAATLLLGFAVLRLVRRK